MAKDFLFFFYILELTPKSNILWYAFKNPEFPAAEFIKMDRLPDGLPPLALIKDFFLNNNANAILRIIVHCYRCIDLEFFQILETLVCMFQDYALPNAPIITEIIKRFTPEESDQILRELRLIE